MVTWKDVLATEICISKLQRKQREMRYSGQYSNYVTHWKFRGSSKRPDWLWIQPGPLRNGNRSYFPGAKRPSHDVDHSALYSTESKNEWSYISYPPYASLMWTGTSSSLYL